MRNYLGREICALIHRLHIDDAIAIAVGALDMLECRFILIASLVKESVRAYSA